MDWLANRQTDITHRATPAACLIKQPVISHLPPQGPLSLNIINFQQRFIIYALHLTHTYTHWQPLEVNLICKLCVCVCVCKQFVTLSFYRYFSFGVFLLIVLLLSHWTNSSNSFHIFFISLLQPCDVAAPSPRSLLLWFPVTVCCYNAPISPQGSIKFHLILSIDVYCRCLINLAR